MTIKAIDLFCGAGGLTRGLIDAGLQVVAGYDVDEACRFAYEKNNAVNFYNKDINELNYCDFPSDYLSAEVRVLAGCAPCQPFSKYTQARPKDMRWSLLYRFRELIMNGKPEIVTMENVPELVKHAVYDDFVSALETCGYFVTTKVVACEKYSIPQKRSRLVLLASKFGHIQLNDIDSKIITVRDAIASMPVVNAGEEYQGDLLHSASKLSEKNHSRIIHSVPGGTWKDWPKELVCECHKKSSGQSYKSVYGRMEWDKPSPTITTQCTNYGSGRFGHPEQNRAITLREAALLQTFPPTYQFSDEQTYLSKNTLARLIGNAVPVQLGNVIGKAIIEHLAHYVDRPSF